MQTHSYSTPLRSANGSQNESSMWAFSEPGESALLLIKLFKLIQASSSLIKMCEVIIVLLSNILSIFYTSLYWRGVQPRSVSQTSSSHKHSHENSTISNQCLLSCEVFPWPVMSTDPSQWHVYSRERSGIKRPVNNDRERRQREQKRRGYGEGEALIHWYYEV